MKTILALALSLYQIAAHAQFTEVITSFSGGTPDSVGPGVAGVSLTVTAVVPPLRSVGVFDSNGGAGLFNAHEVGVWNVATHVLLGDATVPAGRAGTFQDGAWYVNLAAPLALAVGQSYVIGAFYKDSDFDFAFGNATVATTASGITLGDARLSTGTGFEYPDLAVAGADSGFFGANASFAAVPEPSQWSALVGALLLLFALLRPARADSVSGALARAPRAELPAVAVRLVSHDAAVRPAVMSWVKAHRPAALSAVTNALASHRPPVTPGNDHGKRPTVPPGRRNYGSPQ